MNSRTGEAEARAVVAEATALGVRASCALGDVGDPDDVRRIAAEAAAFGTVDIVVNNAAIRPESPLLSMSEDEWPGMNTILGHAGRAHVSAAKHGLWGLTKALARELGPHGITVNAVSPGPIDTERRDAAMARQVQSQIAQIPLRRLGRRDEVASLCAFLASDEAGFISGQMVGVNGAPAT